MREASTMPERSGGLRGATVADSTICFIDGQKGILEYFGYPIQQLAEHSTFEEVVFLLWNGRLPTEAELAELDGQLKDNREVPAEIWGLARSLPKSAIPMETLRTAVSALSSFDPDGDDNSNEASRRKAMRLVAKTPTVVAGMYRISQGQDPVPTDRNLSVAADFLRMLNGETPTETAAMSLDVGLVLHAEHELNASTFAGRVIAATASDMYSSVTGALGALKGPLHGGANMAAIHMLQEIGTPEKAESYALEKLGRRELIFGFGHAVYKTTDPRAAFLKVMSEKLGAESGNTNYYDISVIMEEVLMREKSLNANVDFYSASVYWDLGIPIDLFTPIFAMSRMAGWTAHILEQYEIAKLIRPRLNYVGAHDVSYVAMEDR
jgi:citrate synthase